MSQLNIGLIGAGRIGRVHAAAISSRIAAAKLVAVADIDRDAASRLAAEYGASSSYSSHEALLDDARIDAVIVASATHTHTPIIHSAAAAGKHIFCEKPLALDLSEIDSALSAVEQAGVKLQIGFNRRFDADFRRMRAAVLGGEIGEPQMLHIISRDPGPPTLEYIRSSGGIFLDMTIHDLDMVRFLLGREATEVYACGSVLVDPSIGEAGDVDTAMVFLKFDGGALGSIENSRKAVYGYDQRAEILGSAGSIRVDNKYANSAVISTGQSIHRDLPLHFFLERYAESYVNELEAFVEAILSNGPVPVTGHDGRASVVMALAATVSLRQNRPVRIAEMANGHPTLGSQ